MFMRSCLTVFVLIPCLLVGGHSFVVTAPNVRVSQSRFDQEALSIAGGAYPNDEIPQAQHSSLVVDRLANENRLVSDRAVALGHVGIMRTINSFRDGAIKIYTGYSMLVAKNALWAGMRGCAAVVSLNRKGLAHVGIKAYLSVLDPLWIKETINDISGAVVQGNNMIIPSVMEESIERSSNLRKSISQELAVPMDRLEILDWRRWLPDIAFHLSVCLYVKVNRANPAVEILIADPESTLYFGRMSFSNNAWQFYPPIMVLAGAS